MQISTIAIFDYSLLTYAWLHLQLVMLSATYLRKTKVQKNWMEMLSILHIFAIKLHTYCTVANICTNTICEIPQSGNISGELGRGGGKKCGRQSSPIFTLSDCTLLKMCLSVYKIYLNTETISIIFRKFNFLHNYLVF